MEINQKLRNMLVAGTAILLTILLFLGFQATHQDNTLAATASHTIDWEVAQANKKPTLLEFYADWCTTCQEMAPDNRELQKNFTDRVNFVMLDVDNHRWLPEVKRFKVDGVPHFVFLNDENKVLGEAIGFVPKEVMEENLSSLSTGNDLPHQKVTGRKSDFTNPLPADDTQPQSHGSIP